MNQTKNRASAAASALGKLGRGKPKNFTPGYRKILSQRLADARKKRLQILAEKLTPQPQNNGNL